MSTVLKPLVDLRNQPDQLKPLRLRASQPSVDAEGFFDVVSDAFNLHLKSVEAPAGTAPFFVHTFPKERLTKVDEPFDGITFRVLSSVPAQVKNDGTVSRRPIVFKTADPNKAGYNQVTMMWSELLTAEFSVWSKSNATRSSLLTWFHRFMLRYANAYKFFEARGADKFQFVGRGEDDFETHEEQEIYFGTLTYQVQLQLIETYSERIIDTLTVNTQLSDD